MSERWLAAVAVLACMACAPARAQEPLQPLQPRNAPAVPRGALDAIVETDKGSFTVRLASSTAPEHARYFTETARRGGYDGTLFHRVVPGAIVQGGDPLTKDGKARARWGSGGLGVLKAEFSDLPFRRGTVAAARRPGSPDSGGSQFFVCLADQPALEGQYTVIGHVIDGMDVVDAIGRVPVQGDRPTERVAIRHVRVRPAAMSVP